MFFIYILSSLIKTASTSYHIILSDIIGGDHYLSYNKKTGLVSHTKDKNYAFKVVLKFDEEKESIKIADQKDEEVFLSIESDKELSSTNTEYDDLKIIFGKKNESKSVLYQEFKALMISKSDNEFSYSKYRNRYEFVYILKYLDGCLSYLSPSGRPISLEECSKDNKNQGFIFTVVDEIKSRDIYRKDIDSLQKEKSYGSARNKNKNIKDRRKKAENNEDSGYEEESEDEKKEKRQRKKKNVYKNEESAESEGEGEEDEEHEKREKNRNRDEGKKYRKNRRVEEPTEEENSNIEKYQEDINTKNNPIEKENNTNEPNRSNRGYSREERNAKEMDRYEEEHGAELPRRISYTEQTNNEPYDDDGIEEDYISEVENDPTAFPFSETPLAH